MPDFSVLILTKNEEYDLPGCLDSIENIEDVVVCDSYSTDATQSIAAKRGARVVLRPEYDTSMAFGGDEANHRTWAIREIRYKYKWLLVIDADERLSPESVEELHKIAQIPAPDIVAYRIRRRDFFQGRQLKYVQQSRWFIRFFLPEFVHYERRVNPVVQVKGSVGTLANALDHYPFSKGMSHWFSRHNVYSTLEVQQLHDMRYAGFKPSFAKAFFDPSAAVQRIHLKYIYYTIPARPLAKFLLIYVFKLGFLDGMPGFRFACMVMIYEYMIDLKFKELG